MIRMFFGSPGCGKTTFAVKMLRHHRGYRYSNFECAGADEVDIKEIGKSWRPRERSYIAIDEAGIEFNNRKFKTFPEHLIRFMKLHRHYNCNIDVFSQSWEDTDVTIRRLCDQLWYVQKIGPFSIARRVNKRVCVDDQTQQIIDGYRFLRLWTFLFFQRPIRICFRPKYYKFFNSFHLSEEERRLPFYDEISSQDPDPDPGFNLVSPL